MSNFNVEKKPVSVVNILIGVNVIFFMPWILSYLTKNGEYYTYLINVCALNINNNAQYTIENGSYWQIITSMFTHGGIGHIFFNMYGLYIFGKPVEYRWGKGKFLSFYLTSGILANIASVIFLKLLPSQPSTSLIGASGAIMAVLLAFGSFYPETMLLLFFIIPLKVKWAILIFAGVELFFEVTGTMSGIAHFTHLFGLLFGFLYMLVFFKVNPVKEMYFRNKNNFNNFS